MDFYDLVNARYSVRTYTDEAVGEDVIHRILNAARLAPSAANKQPIHYFVVRDEAMRQRLIPDRGGNSMSKAAVALVVCASPDNAWVRSFDGKNHADIDAAIAMEHIVLAATEEGLGTCWICAFDPKVVRQVLSLPHNMEPIAITPLGHTTSEPQPKNRKNLDELVTWL
jgi:nitroreductase